MHQPPELLIVKYLLALNPIVIALFADQNTAYGPLVFRDALPLKLSPAGLRAVSVSSTPGGTAPTLTGVYSATVQTRIYCDHTRDPEGNAAVEDGLDRAWAAFGNLDPQLNTTEAIMLTPTVQSNRVGSPLETWDENQNLPYLAVNYDVSVMADR